MVFRALAVFAVIMVLAWVSLTSLVNNHVSRVILAHSMDKAEHFSEIISGWDNLDAVFETGQVPETAYEYFADMAVATGLLDIVIFDKSESTRIILDFVGDNKSPSVVLDRAVTEFSATDRIPLTPSNYPPNAAPDSELQLLINEVEKNGETRWHSIVSAPLSNGGDAGRISVHLNVTTLYLAYKNGLIIMGLFMAGLGVLLFGIPSIGYLLQRRRMEASMRSAKYLTRFDPLTNVYNRSEFLKNAQNLFDEEKLSALVYIDLDQFKQINDVYGHDVGDALLVWISRNLERSFGPDCILGRFGGDEFCIAIGPMPETDLRQRVEDAQENCNKMVQLRGVSITGSISLGVAGYQEGNDLECLLQNADTALFIAKQNGGNRAEFYAEQMGSKMRRRQYVEMCLKQAPEKELLDLFFQPLVRADNRETFGYEALLRLFDDKGTAISPGEFIPIAEELGLIENIGAWVIEQATMRVASFDDHSSVAINLSPVQFKSGNLPSIVKKALAKAQLSPDRLELEITESLLIDEVSDVGFQIDVLQDMGVRVAMDDFGTGFSSLNYLWKFGLDRIKIDRSFVAAIEQNPERSIDVIGTIVLLGERLGMEITAEGIETENQADLMASLGCDVLQGYFFGKPKPLPCAADLVTQPA